MRGIESAQTDFGLLWQRLQSPIIRNKRDMTETVWLADRERTAAWGRALGARLRAGDILALHGDLGAGKTTLTQAIAAGLGVAGPVTSPTFTLVHEYPGS